MAECLSCWSIRTVTMGVFSSNEFILVAVTLSEAIGLANTEAAAPLHYIDTNTTKAAGARNRLCWGLRL